MLLFFCSLCMGLYEAGCSWQVKSMAASPPCDVHGVVAALVHVRFDGRERIKVPNRLCAV